MGSQDVQITIAGDNLYVDADGTANAVTPSDNMTLAISELKSSAAVTRALALGINFDVVGGGASAGISAYFLICN